MTTPSDPENGQSPPHRVDLGKADPAGTAGTAGTADPAGEVPFDPYRFGKPDHPIPAEYAPPGYTGPITPAPGPYAGGPVGSPPGWSAGAPPGSAPGNPFANPPGTPYGPGPGQPPYAGGPPSPYGPAQGQPPYGSPPTYGYGPPPPQYHGYTQPRSNNGKAIAALVLGILSIIFCWLSVFDAVFVILALIFGLIALSETKNGRGRGRGMAIAGLVCVIVGALLATLISIKVFRAVDKCGGFNQADRSSFNQCLRDNL